MMNDPIKVRIFQVSHYFDIEVFDAKDEAEAHQQAIAVFNEQKPKMEEVMEPTILAVTMKDDLPAGEVVH
jgi:hypothetical protein